MTDTGRLAEEIREKFEVHGFPEEMLERFDQLECLAHHKGRETFLLREKTSGRLCIAKCYSKENFDLDASHDLLSALKHPGIPESYGHYENDTMVCFVREYVEGIPLDRYAEENDLSREEVTDICLKLADILIYLHGQDPPVIHRDIKPENIIIREDGSISLIDFDIARTFKESEDHDTIFFGTKGYAPPEQYGFTQTDARSDIYSFGVLLRFLMTDSVRENDKVSMYAPIRRIIDRCTAFAPEKRYASMEAVKKDLENANPAAQRRRSVRIGLIALAAVLVLSFAGYKIYEKVTYNPFTDGDVVASVMPDEERQEEAVTYLREKYGTHLFDEKEEYFTTGMVRQALVEMYGLDKDYVYSHDTEEPPDEDGNWFMPWSLDDNQYVDRDYMAYFVTKLHWPEVVADWSSLKEDTGEYPGVIVAQKWCDDHGILIGVNRPKELSRGEAAVAFYNAEKVYEAMQDM